MQGVRNPHEGFQRSSPFFGDACGGVQPAAFPMIDESAASAQPE